MHHEDDEAWYVLEGTLRFRLGEETLEVGAGGSVMAPKGTALASSAPTIPSCSADDDTDRPDYLQPGTRAACSIHRVISTPRASSRLLILT